MASEVAINSAKLAMAERWVQKKVHQSLSIIRNLNNSHFLEKFPCQVSWAYLFTWIEVWDWNSTLAPPPSPASPTLSCQASAPWTCTWAASSFVVTTLEPPKGNPQIQNHERKPSLNVILNIIKIILAHYILNYTSRSTLDRQPWRFMLITPKTQANVHFFSLEPQETSKHMWKSGLQIATPFSSVLQQSSQFM